MEQHLNFTKDCVEEAYCFFHQKLRVYEHSTNPTQRDDIEYAISQYIDGMNRHLYTFLSQGKHDFLLDHTSFEHDMRNAITQLEEKM